MAKRQNSRQGDGGTYMVIADDSEEFPLALRYALRLAHTRRGHVAIVHIIETQDFVHWGGIEEKMRAEQRREAEEKLWSICRTSNELNGQIPGMYIVEGETIPAITDILEDDDNINMMILANGKGNSDPLVAHFTGKSGCKCPVPVLVIPGHLDEDAIDALA